MVTIAQCLRQYELPRLEKRLLLQMITGYSAVQLITCDQKKISKIQYKAFIDLCQRRIIGEPMAYLLGKREFYGRSFVVSPEVLIPRPETEHLLEIALKLLPLNGKLWDLGTGSGVIAISAQLERPDAYIFASDVSATALDVARHNAQIWSAPVQFAQGSWFEAFNCERNFDILLSNPPYIEKDDWHLQQGDLRFEPQTALTDFYDGLSCIRAIAKDAKKFLKHNGYLLFEHGYQQAKAVRSILAQNEFVEIETISDLAGLDRITLGKYK